MTRSDHRSASDEFMDPLIRPFILTGGRTGSTLPVETVAFSTDHPNVSSLSREKREISELCRMPHAVAEISAKLGLPLGVCRVLVGDLAEQGVLLLSQTESVKADLELLGRILNGIRKS
jgi:Protein of unknown function (DUF742)